MAKKMKDFDDGDMFFDMDGDFSDLDDFSFDDETGGKSPSFFKNLGKSAKNFAVAAGNRYAPDFMDFKQSMKELGNSASMGAMDARERAVEAIAKAKNKASGASNIDPKSIAKELYTSGMDRIKKGNWFKDPNAIDFDFGDDDDWDDDDDDSESMDSDERKKKKGKVKRGRYRPIKLNMGGLSVEQLMEVENQQTIAQTKVQYGIYKRQALRAEQHFGAQINIMKNIASNVHLIAKIMSKENIKGILAGLEFQKKSLALQLDQVALLKEMRNVQMRLAGGKKKGDKYRDTSTAFERIAGFGFSADEFAKNAKRNFKDIMDASMFGQVKMMIEMQNEMSGMMGGKKKGPLGKLAPFANMAGGMLADSILPPEFKLMMENVNKASKALPSLLMSKLNTLGQNASGPLGMIGQIFGTQQYESRIIDTGLKDPRKAMPFDAQTHKAITTVIPGYLSKITAALTGGEETYFDYSTGNFKTNTSLRQKTDRTVKEAMYAAEEVSGLRNTFVENISEKNKHSQHKVTSNEIMRGIDSFMENMVRNKFEMHPNIVANNRDVVFKNINPIVQNHILEMMMDPAVVHQLKSRFNQFNSVKDSVSTNMSRVQKEIAKHATDFGGELAYAQLNTDYQNEDLENIIKEKEKRLAAIRAGNTKSKFSANMIYKAEVELAQLRNELQFNEANFGVVREMGKDVKVGSSTVSFSSPAKGLESIYNLLLNGIIVYNQPMSKEAKTFLAASTKAVHKRAADFTKAESTEATLAEDAMHESIRLNRENEKERREMVLNRGSNMLGGLFRPFTTKINSALSAMGLDFEGVNIHDEPSGIMAGISLNKFENKISLYKQDLAATEAEYENATGWKRFKLGIKKFGLSKGVQLGESKLGKKIGTFDPDKVGKEIDEKVTTTIKKKYKELLGKGRSKIENKIGVEAFATKFDKAKNKVIELRDNFKSQLYGDALSEEELRGDGKDNKGIYNENIESFYMPEEESDMLLPGQTYTRGSGMGHSPVASGFATSGQSAPNIKSSVKNSTVNRIQYTDKSADLLKPVNKIGGVINTMHKHIASIDKKMPGSSKGASGVAKYVESINKKMDKVIKALSKVGKGTVDKKALRSIKRDNRKTRRVIKRDNRKTRRSNRRTVRKTKKAARGPGLLRRMTGGLWSGTKRLGKGAWGLGTGAAKGLWDGAKKAGGAIWDGTKWVGRNAWDLGKKAGGAIWDGTKWVARKTADVASNIYGSAKKLLPKIGSGIMSLGRRGKNAIAGLFGRRKRSKESQEPMYDEDGNIIYPEDSPGEDHEKKEGFFSRMGSKVKNFVTNPFGLFTGASVAKGAADDSTKVSESTAQDSMGIDFKKLTQKDATIHILRILDMWNRRGGIAETAGGGMGGLSGLFAGTLGLLGLPFKGISAIGKGIKGLWTKHKVGDKLKDTGEAIKDKAIEVKDKAVEVGGKVKDKFVSAKEQQKERKEREAEKKKEKRDEIMATLQADQATTMGEMAKTFGKWDKGGIPVLGAGGTGTGSSTLGKLGKGLIGAGAVAIGAGVANMVRGVGSSANKFKEAKQLKEAGAGTGEIAAHAITGRGSSSFDAEGNKIQKSYMDSVKDNSSVSKVAQAAVGLKGIVKAGKGLIKAGSKLAAKAPGAAKVTGKLASFLQKLVAKPFFTKIFGKAAGGGIVKAIMSKLSKSALGQFAGKIAKSIAKAAQPIGWALIAYDFASGMKYANRYFKLPKGSKPNAIMRGISGLVNVLSGLLFGLLPPEIIAPLLYGLIAKDSTKKAMDEARKFGDARAKIMGITDGERLMEFETKTLSEWVGGASKSAMMLGFGRGKEAVKQFKDWNVNVYKPAMDMFKQLALGYGGVSKLSKLEGTEEEMEKQKVFRTEYLKRLKDMINKGNLKQYFPGAKDNKDSSSGTFGSTDEEDDPDLQKSENGEDDDGDDYMSAPRDASPEELEEISGVINSSSEITPMTTDVIPTPEPPSVEEIKSPSGVVKMDHSIISDALRNKSTGTQFTISPTGEMVVKSPSETGGGIGGGIKGSMPIKSATSDSQISEMDPLQLIAHYSMLSYLELVKMNEMTILKEEAEVKETKRQSFMDRLKGKVSGAIQSVKNVVNKVADTKFGKSLINMANKKFGPIVGKFAGPTGFGKLKNASGELYDSLGSTGDGTGIRITQLSGPRFPIINGVEKPELGMTQTHKGIDIGSPDWSKDPPLYAIADGVVSKINESNTSFGNSITVDHGGGLMSLYGHLDQFGVEEGQTIKKGQPIGIMGNTGNSTAPHLHLQMTKDGRLIDPATYLTKGTVKPIMDAKTGGEATNDAEHLMIPYKPRKRETESGGGDFQGDLAAPPGQNAAIKFNHEVKEGLEILEKIHQEQLRHNKISESYFESSLAALIQIAGGNMGLMRQLNSNMKPPSSFASLSEGR